jgi:hypothetical protein
MKQLASLRAREGWGIETIDVKLRAGTQADAARTICYEAFKAINTQHNFAAQYLALTGRCYGYNRSGSPGYRPDLPTLI